LKEEREGSVRRLRDCIVLGRVRESDNLLTDMVGREGLRREIERLVGSDVSQTSAW
jgi:hypothetical protein